MADDKTVTYGTAPTLTTTVNGLQNGDTAAQTLSTVASVAVDGSKSSSNNYTVGTHALTVTQKEHLQLIERMLQLHILHPTKHMTALILQQ